MRFAMDWWGSEGSRRNVVSRRPGAARRHRMPPAQADVADMADMADRVVPWNLSSLTQEAHHQHAYALRRHPQLLERRPWFRLDRIDTRRRAHLRPCVRMAARFGATADEASGLFRGGVGPQGQTSEERSAPKVAASCQASGQIGARCNGAMGRGHPSCHSSLPGSVRGCRRPLEAAAVGGGALHGGERCHLHRLRCRQVGRSKRCLAHSRTHPALDGLGWWLARRVAGPTVSSPQVHKAAVPPSVLGHRRIERHGSIGTVLTCGA